MNDVTGMNAVRAKLKKEGHSLSWMADELSVTRGAVSQWSKVPAERIGEVARLTGLSHEILRPDLFLSEPAQ